MGFLWVIVLFITCMFIANLSRVAILILDDKQMIRNLPDFNQILFSSHSIGKQVKNSMEACGYKRTRVRATCSPFMFSLVL